MSFKKYLRDHKLVDTPENFRDNYRMYHEWLHPKPIHPTPERSTPEIVIHTMPTRRYRRKLPSQYIEYFLDDMALCPYCGKKLTVDDCSIDHIVPRAKGGTDKWTNLVLCCKDCNTAKWDLSLLDFLVRRVNGQKTSPFAEK